MNLQKELQIMMLRTTKQSPAVLGHKKEILPIISLIPDSTQVVASKFVEQANISKYLIILGYCYKCPYL